MKCVNDQYVGADALDEARKGIINPKLVVIKRGLIFRYGGSLENARTGGWWLDSDQFQRVEAWAAANGLAVPHAARVLSGVLHKWRETSVRLNMLVLVRAEIVQPLKAYSGIGAPQWDDDYKEKGGLLREFIEPRVTGSEIVQLFIPGLDKLNPDPEILRYGAPVTYDVGASHIFGVPGIPAGTQEH